MLAGKAWARRADEKRLLIVNALDHIVSGD
jgi:hypothetical protein